jgi:methylmalonyl-CoA/ethylmalonyl-CoA epimerase
MIREFTWGQHRQGRKAAAKRIDNRMKISHIGIAVESLQQASEIYGALFGNDDPHRETVDEQHVSIASFPVGDAVVELTAATDEESPIAKFIAKRGQGIHHIAFEVEDVQAELDRLKAAGVQLIDETPKEGAHDMLIAFVHPSSFNGVLVELCQKKRK